MSWLHSPLLPAAALSGGTTHTAAVSVAATGSVTVAGVAALSGAVAVAATAVVTIAGDLVAGTTPATVIPFGYAGARRGPISGEPLRRLYKRASLGERIAVLGGRSRRR